MSGFPIKSMSSGKVANLDLVRGLSALGILIWHYQHFYYPAAGYRVSAELRKSQPLYELFWVFYEYGASAVCVFWVLSGYVFFHVYRMRSEISAKEFFGNRFARLYPLHFLSLIAVALLQIFSWWLFGEFQIYRFNDIRHFILNVFMASHWGLQEGYSFNGPIWSVSVEIVAYVLFFSVLKVSGARIQGVFLMGLVACAGYFFWGGEVFRCALMFSIGGLICVIRAGLRAGSRLIEFLMVSSLFGLGVISSVLQWFAFSQIVVWLLCPCLIWGMAFLESLGWSSGEIGLRFGELTYASYLIHVPVQIVLIIFFQMEPHYRLWIGSAWFLGAYVLGVVALSLVVNRWVERPLNELIRALVSGAPKPILKSV